MGILQQMAKGFAKPKPAAEISQEVIERSIPAVDEPVATELIERAGPPTVPGKNVPDMGRPSATDVTQRNINFGHLDTEDDILSFIDTVSEQQDHSFDTTRRGVVGNEQTLEESSNALTLDQLIGRKPGTAYNAAQMTAARRILIDSANSLKKAAEIVRGPNASEADMLEFRRLVAQHYGIQAQISGATAEAGRALQAFRINAQGGAVAQDELRMALQNSGGQMGARRLAELISQAGDDPAKISKVARDTWHANSADMFVEYWINGLLSNPTTHAVNTTSNALVAAWAVPERALAAGVSSVLRSGDGGVRYGEAMAQVYGLVHGFKDALKVSWHALKTGETTDPALKLELRRDAITSENISNLLQTGVVGKTAGALGVNPESLRLSGHIAMGVDYLGEIARLPGRFLTAEDALFKTLGYRQELYARAYRQVRAEGLEGDELGKRLHELVQSPPEDLHMAAVDASRYQTFTNPLGEFGQKIQQLSNEGRVAGLPVLKFIMPFIRTPVNIVKYVGHRSPIAPLTHQFQADFMAGGARRDLAIARMGLGSGLMVMASSWTLDGTITGKGPENDGVRNAMRRQGWQPYSIKIGDKYYAFNRLDPLGMMLGLAADAVTVGKYGDDLTAQEAVSTAVIAVAQNLTSKTYLSGVSDMLQAIDDPVRYGDRWLNRMAGTLIPMTSGVAQVERVIDPTLRQANDAMDSIISRIPGWSDTLMPRRNLWGKPIVLEGGLGWDMVSPIYTSTEKFDPVDEEIISNAVNVSMPGKAFGTGRFAVEMMPDEYDRYVILAGEKAKEELDKLVGSAKYQKLSQGPDGGRARAISSVISETREWAKGKLLKEYPALMDALEEAEIARGEALTGRQIGR